jgi:hypothetical protein
MRPKSLGVSTSPRPKCRCHTRFAIERQASAFPRFGHSRRERGARPVRLPGRPTENRVPPRRKPGHAGRRSGNGGVERTIEFPALEHTLPRRGVGTPASVRHRDRNPPPGRKPSAVLEGESRSAYQPPDDDVARNQLSDADVAQPPFASICSELKAVVGWLR